MKFRLHLKPEFRNMPRPKRPFVIRLKPHVAARYKRHRRFQAEGRQPLRYDGGTPIYAPKKGDRKCRLCANWYKPFRPWADQVDPVPVCHGCRGRAQVGMCRTSPGGLEHGEGVLYGALFSTIRAVIWHLEHESES